MSHLPLMKSECISFAFTECVKKDEVVIIDDVFEGDIRSQIQCRGFPMVNPNMIGRNNEASLMGMFDFDEFIPK